MFCGKCGKQLEDDEIVCPWCGEPTGVEAGEKNYSHQPESRGYSQNTCLLYTSDLGGERIIDSDYEDISMGSMGTMTAIGSYEGERDIYDYSGNLLGTYSY